MCLVVDTWCQLASLHVTGLDKLGPKNSNSRGRGRSCIHFVTQHHFNHSNAPTDGREGNFDQEQQLNILLYIRGKGSWYVHLRVYSMPHKVPAPEDLSVQNF